MLASLAGRIYDHAPQQNAFPLDGSNQPTSPFPTFAIQRHSRMPQSRDSIADDVLAELLAFSEANGWVHESQVFAHIESQTGSHTWRDEDRVSDAALHAVFTRYVESFLAAYGDFPSRVAQAIDDFEDAPSVDRLIAVVRTMSASST